GLVHRFIQTLKNNPFCEDKEIGVDRVLPEDRKWHALYGYKKSNVNEEREELMEKIKEKVLLQCSTIELKEKVREKLTEIQHSNGIFSIGIPGHTIGIQMDINNNIFRFYDPNLGIFRLDIPEASPDVCIDTFCEALSTFILIFYSVESMTIFYESMVDI